MAPGKQKGKMKGKKSPLEATIDQEQEEDLAMSEEEMYRIIRETGIMGESAGASAGSSEAFVTMRPSEVQEGRFEELDDVQDEDEDADTSKEPAGSPLSSSRAAPRKLVELIDEDEALPQPDLAQQSTEGAITTPITIASIEEDETFRLVLWMVVFSTLWLCLDLMIHAQYGQDRAFRDELGRAMNVLPALGFVIYFTGKYPSSYLTRAFLFGWSAIGGSYMIHIVNKASYLQVMRRCPILGSLWIWSIVQLDLPSALVSLSAVMAYVKYNGLSVIFPS